MSETLPQGLECLEPFVQRFSVHGTANRAELRGQTSPEERQVFYDAAKDLVPPALDMLDTKQLGQFTEAEQRLMNLTLSFAHIAIALEIQGPDEAKHAKLREHMKIVRSTADMDL